MRAKAETLEPNAVDYDRDQVSGHDACGRRTLCERTHAESQTVREGHQLTVGSSMPQFQQYCELLPDSGPRHEGELTA
jgi:hypothetical protein